MQEIVKNNLPDSKMAIYIHYPFCESKCPYCDFNSHVKNNIDFESFKESYIKEIEYFASRLQNREITSIFFGGGTPSLMPITIFDAILTTIYDNFTVKKGIEVTVEANPGSFEIAKFKNFRESGANRISIGVQSFDNNNLKFLGRKHSADEAQKAIRNASEIFDNFSFDLMHSLQGQNLNDWIRELEFACTFDSNHLSVYQLTIEKGTKFFSDVMTGKISEMHEDDQLRFFENTREALSKKGYENYEISNFAKKGFESQHNLNYWQGGEYLGIGAGAHSRVSFDNCNYTRSAMVNHHQPEKWQQQVVKNQHAIQSSHLVTKEEFLEELLLSGLRLKEGVDIKQIEEILNLEFKIIFDVDKIDKINKQGLVKIDNGFVQIPHKNTILTNAIIAKVIECIKLP